MAKRILVYGGKGALGSSCVSYFKSKTYWVLSIDLFVNEEADANVAIKSMDDWATQSSEVFEGVSNVLGSEKLDAIFCLAGGWAGGNAASADLVKNADQMWKQSVWSSVIASHIAAKHLSPTGILQLTGAEPALGATSGMIGYGMAKAAVHQLTKSVATKNGGLPAGSTALAILPVTLDTPMNRKFMKNADYSKWTPLEHLAQRFEAWVEGAERPVSGSLVKVLTADGNTQFVPVE